MRRGRRSHGRKSSHHKRSHGRRRRVHNPDWKILAFAGVAAIAAGIGASYLMANVNLFNPAKGAGWYVLPAGFVAGGALLLGKMPVIGIALAAVGALLGYEGYSAQSGSEGGTTKGLGAGWNMRRDSGLFDRPHPHAGALGGARAAAMRADQGAGGDGWQGAGALQGPNRHAMRADQGAGGNGWTGAGGVGGLIG